MSHRKFRADWTESEPERICIIKPSAFGDVVQTLPLLPVLQEKFPQAQISWVISNGLSDLVSGHPCLHEWIPFERRGGWQGWKKLLGRLRSSRFDLVFDLQGLLRSAVMTAATGARWRIGLETAREGSGVSCNRMIENSSKEIPAHARYWRIAEVLGVCESSHHTRRDTTITTSSEDLKVVDSLLASITTPILAVHSGARWVTKRWPIEKFATVATRAIKELGMTILLVGSPDEREESERLQGLLPENHVENITGKTTLKQLALCLERADLLLSNDSGPMHLAAGLGTPVAGIFTCTSPVRSGPRVGTGCPPHQLVATQLECAAGYHKQCPLKGAAHHACFSELDIDRVWQAVARIAQQIDLGQNSVRHTA